MNTKFDVGDEVLIKGMVKAIRIEEKEPWYLVDVDAEMMDWHRIVAKESTIVKADKQSRWIYPVDYE